MRTSPRTGLEPFVVLLVFLVSFGLPSSARAQDDAGAPPPVAPEPPPPAADSAPAPVATPPAGAAARPDEVVVRGRPSDARQRQHSAEAVNVVDLRRARRESADLGEVVARTQGVAVRRAGGLGSSARFSINGLYDDQIRFFLDGVPLEVAGYPFGFANVPASLVERVEVYRGVVPIRFGADVLGGALNLVTDPRFETRLGASYQVGSFGTRRLTLDGRYRHAPTGFVVGGAALLDVARNDYTMLVETANARGRQELTKVRRLHDGYLAYGGSVEVGFVDRPWARKLLLRGFASTYEKELQHNIVMTVPYGEVRYGETIYGATARYEQPLSRDVELAAVASYARRAIDFVDRAERTYDWNRQPRPTPVPAEMGSVASDQTAKQDNLFARVTVDWAPHPQHALRLALTPTYATRTGDERLQIDPAARDPLTAQRDLFTFVSGLEYEVNALPVAGAGASRAVEERRRGSDYALQNSLFVKQYAYHAATEEILPAGAFRPLTRDFHALGIGDAVRMRITPSLYAKASYELARRLPRPDEVFGNGVLVVPNLRLEPEVSHNVNFGPRLELRRTPIGAVTVDINAFWRESDRLIVLLNGDQYFKYENVYHARALGIENALAWLSPGRWVSLDGTLTFQDVRNTSNQGSYGNTAGDRIPNRPSLFASWGARARIANFPGANDTLEPFYVGRFVDSFFRAWESHGNAATKLVVGAQLTHGVGVSWSVDREIARITTTLEVQNLTDAAVFDFYGIQRPGRAIFLKATGEL